MIPNIEKVKTIPAKGIEILFLKTIRVPTEKNIDEIRISYSIELVMLHCTI